MVWVKIFKFGDKCINYEVLVLNIIVDKKKDMDDCLGILKFCL